MGTATRLCLTEDTLAGCVLPATNEALGRPLVSDPSKRRLIPQLMFPEAFAESCRPGALVFTRLNGANESQLAPLSRASAMAQLLEHCPWASYDIATARSNLRLARLVEQSACYTHAAGRDLLEDPERAVSLLASASASILNDCIQLSIETAGIGRRRKSE